MEQRRGLLTICFLAVPSSLCHHPFAVNPSTAAFDDTSLWRQVEGKPLEAHDELDETALGGIPSLDFRPVLELFAPTGQKFQMSPCGECGGTLEVACGVNIEELSEENLTYYQRFFSQRTGPSMHTVVVSGLRQ